jgi:hypothetical protein
MVFELIVRVVLALVFVAGGFVLARLYPDLFPKAIKSVDKK